MKSVKEQLRGKMWDKTNDKLLNQVSFTLWNQVSSTLWNELDGQIPHGLSYEIYWTIRGHFNEELKK